jgi:hypothetical protein
MQPNLGNLSVERMIIHEVPKHFSKDSESAPVFSEVESTLDTELRLFFREKIIQSVTSSWAVPVEFAVGSSSPVPGVLTELLAVSPDLVELSKKIATHLFESQDGTNSGGLLTVVRCSLNGGPSAAVLKLEKEEGVRLKRLLVDGKTSLDVDHIKELILSQKTRFFKIGLFSRDPDDDDVTGRILDDQRPSAPGVAQFFLSFLGCRYLDDPQLSTRAFFQAAQNYVNDEVTSPVQKVNVLNHLVSELQNNSAMVNVRKFARTYLPTKLRAPFETHMKANGVDNTVFQKDVALIDKQLTKLAYKFDHGVSIVGPADAMKTHVKIKKEGNGFARAEVRGKLETVKS